MLVLKGGETLLADLKGPWKVTYFYTTDDTRVKWHPGLVLRYFGMSKPNRAFRSPCPISLGP